MADLIKQSTTEIYKTTLGTDEVVIGDVSKEAELTPKITFTRWNKECSLSIAYDTLTPVASSVVDGTLYMDTSKEGFYFRQHDDSTMKFGLVLNEKPTTNTWTFKIEGLTDLKVFKRPPRHKDLENGKKEFRSDGGTGEWEQSHEIYKEDIVQREVNGIQRNVIRSRLFLNFLRPKFIDAKGKWVFVDFEIKGSDYIITCPQSFLDAAVYPVIANDTATYQEGVSGYSGCIDVTLKSFDGQADTNQDSTDDLYLSDYSTNAIYLVAFDLADELAGATISSCKVELRVFYDGTGGLTTGAYRIWRAWSETQATWNSRSTGNSWATAGCRNTNDSGSYDGANDRRATADDTFNVTANAWVDWGGATDDAMAVSLQAQLDAGKWYGWAFDFSSGSGEYTAYDSETGTTSNRPKITVIYTAGGGAGWVSGGKLKNII